MELELSRPLIVGILVLSAALSAAPEEDSAREFPEFFYLHLRGKIDGKYDFVMDLTSVTRDNMVSGSYYYESRGITIRLDGRRLDEGGMELTEYHPGDGPYREDEATAKFEGRLTPSPEGWSFSGIWKSKDGQKEFPFTATEDYSQSASFKPYRLQGDMKLDPDNKESPFAEFDSLYLEPVGAAAALQADMRRLIFGDELGAQEPTDALKAQQTRFFKAATVWSTRYTSLTARSA